MSHPTVEEFRAEIREFLDESVASGVACPDFGVIMPPSMHDRAQAWQRHCFASGFAGIDWETEVGGRGLSAAHAAAWREECARSDVAPYMNVVGVVFAGGAIRRFGSEEQRKRYLSGTLAAELFWCQLFSEPGSGSDLASLSTKAVPTDDGWLVTGQKVWSSGAHLSDHAILLARTEPDERSHRGISFFLFDMHGPGVDVRPLKQMTGDTEFCEVFLDEAPVASADLLGSLHGGWAVASSVLADERAEVGAHGISLRRRIERMAAALPDDGASRHRATTLISRAAAFLELLDRSSGDPRLGPLVKLGLTELDADLAGWGVDCLGAGGMLTGDAADEFLYAPGMRLAGGTSEIQRNIIGERLLGLPREPRAPASK